MPVPVVRHPSLTDFQRPSHFTEFEGAIEGPINPVNYSGTQINVWGMPPAGLGNYLKRNPPMNNEKPPVVQNESKLLK